MARKGPWGEEDSWELSETQFAEKDIGNGNGNGNGCRNGSARVGNSQHGSKQNGNMGQNGKSENGTIQNGASQNGSSKNGRRGSFSNQNGGHCDGRGNGLGKKTQTSDKVSNYCQNMLHE